MRTDARSGSSGRRFPFALGACWWAMSSTISGRHREGIAIIVDRHEANAEARAAAHSNSLLDQNRVAFTFTASYTQLSSAKSSSTVTQPSPSRLDVCFSREGKTIARVDR